MNTPKTEPKVRKPTIHHEPRREPARTPAPARPANTSNAMIEACDRLGQKLDAFADAIREQTESWRQPHPPDAPRPVPREEPHHRHAPQPIAEPRAISENPPASPPEPAPEPAAPNQPDNPTAPSAAQSSPQAPIPQSATPNATPTERPEASPAEDPMPDLAGKSKTIIDTLSQTSGWQEQAESVQRALEGIMDYLENQSNIVTRLTADVDSIMARLSELEQRQSNLQSQLNNNRWGP